VLYGLQLGHTVVVTKGRTQRRAKYVLKTLRQGKADGYFGSPFLWVEMMAQTGSQREPLPDTLKAVLLGGAPVTPDFLRQLKQWLHPSTKVMAIYGLTEAGPVCVASAEEKLEWTGVGDYVGAPLPGVRLELADCEDDTGEVIVHSSALYTGYLEEPERAAEDGLRTGDLGRLATRNGAIGLELLGRKKDMIIRGSVNVYPSTVEPLLREIADDSGRVLLRECALIGLWNPRSQDEEIVLCYEPKDGVGVDSASLRHAVNRVAGSDASPDHYLEVNSIPVTGRQNKVDKEKLRNLAAARFGLQPRPGAVRADA
jgi:acyl-CoA synthetase (AMP-forming)/AMP-acid ligase II